MVSYPVRLTTDTDGSLLVTSPDFPELTTFGTGRDDALSHARDALEEAIAARIADHRPLPHPSKGRQRVELPALTSLKIELCHALVETGITRAELARKLKWNRESVDRLFRLDHQSRLQQIEAALAALGKHIKLEVA